MACFGLNSHNLKVTFECGTYSIWKERISFYFLYLALGIYYQ